MTLSLYLPQTSRQFSTHNIENNLNEWKARILSCLSFGERSANGQLQNSTKKGKEGNTKSVRVILVTATLIVVHNNSIDNDDHEIARLGSDAVGMQCHGGCIDEGRRGGTHYAETGAYSNRTQRRE